MTVLCLPLSPEISQKPGPDGRRGAEVGVGHGGGAQGIAETVVDRVLAVVVCHDAWFTDLNIESFAASSARPRCNRERTVPIGHSRSAAADS